MSRGSSFARPGGRGRPPLPRAFSRADGYIVASSADGCFVAGGLLLPLPPTRCAVLTEKDTIVLADFANSTGDAVFDDTLKTALSVSLNQSPFLNVLSDSKVAADFEADETSSWHETHA